MKPVAWMIALSVTSWLCAGLIVDRQTSIEILFGMLGPLAVVSGTWLVTEFIHKRHPELTTPLMASAFAVKMLFFAAYVAVMLRVVLLRPVPFVISFTSYFVALYLMEALYLRRLFSGESQ
jgi:hypothetical protein